MGSWVEEATFIEPTAPLPLCYLGSCVDPPVPSLISFKAVW